MSTPAAAGWTVTTTSARGAAHVQRGAPNQDAVAAGERDGVLAVAVSDGHGGAAYTRSDVGSRFAVDIGVAVALSLADEVQRASGERAVTVVARRRLAPEVVAQWRAAVEAHLQDNPLADAERTAPVVADPVVAYGATLLLALVTPTTVLLCQLGDGDVGLLGADGRAAEDVMGHDDRLVGGQTTSLCLTTAVDDFRYAVRRPEDTAVLLLATDGYGNSFASREWRREVLEDIRGTLDDRGFDYVREQLPGWAAESARTGGDDVTLALVARPEGMPARAAGAAPQAAAVPRPSAPTSRSPHRLGLIAVSAVIGAALGALVTAAVSGDSGTATPTAVTRTLPPTGAPSAEPSVLQGQNDPGVTGRAATLVGPGGRIVAFLPKPGDARPTILSSTSASTPVTTLTAFGTRWRIESGRLLVVPDVGEPERLVVRGDDGAAVRLSGITTANALLWVLTEDGRHIAAVDPGTRQQVKDSYQRAQSRYRGTGDHGERDPSALGRP